MIETVEAPNSGYRFMPGVSQYSAGVAALPPIGGWTYDVSGAASAPILYAGLLVFLTLAALLAFRLFQRRPATLVR